MPNMVTLDGWLAAQNDGGINNKYKKIQMCTM